MLRERRQQQEKEEDEIVRNDITVLSIYDKKKMKRNPVNNTFNLIGRAFTVMILYTMMNSKNIRFNRLLESIDGIGPKTFSKRLREMEQNGLIQRKIYHERPIRIEYSLTEKGMATKPILQEMAAFSIKYCAKDIFKNEKS